MSLTPKTVTTRRFVTPQWFHRTVENRRGTKVASANRAAGQHCCRVGAILTVLGSKASAAGCFQMETAEPRNFVVTRTNFNPFDRVSE